MTRTVDYAGQSFHGVMVLGRLAGYRWRCRCHCGREFVACIYNVKSGATKSCGCAPKGRKPMRPALPSGVFSAGTKRTPCYLAMGTGVSILGDYPTAEQAIAARAAWEADHSPATATHAAERHDDATHD